MIILCLAVINVGSALKKDENYYLQAFLKECKYIDKVVSRHITEGIKVFSSESEEQIKSKYCDVFVSEKV